MRQVLRITLRAKWADRPTIQEAFFRKEAAELPHMTTFLDKLNQQDLVKLALWQKDFKGHKPKCGFKKRGKSLVKISL